MFVYFGSICVELSDGGSSVRGLTLCWVLVLREMRVRLGSFRGLVSSGSQRNWTTAFPGISKYVR